MSDRVAPPVPGRTVKTQARDIRVLLIDNEEMSRRGFAAALTEAPRITMVGYDRAGIAALAAVSIYRPDVVLFNAASCGDWVRAVGDILAAYPTPGGPRVIVVTRLESYDLLLPVVRAGVAGVLLRDLSAEDLVYAIRHVANGGCVLSPTVTSQLVTRLRSAESVLCFPTTSLDGLTRREREVLAGLADGKSNLEIAADTHLTVATVKSHVSSILIKLRVRDRVQAALVGQRARFGL